MNSKDQTNSTNSSDADKYFEALINQARWKQHALFWIIVLIFSSLNWMTYAVGFLTEFLYHFILLSTSALFVYLNFYILIPKLLLKGNIGRYSLALLSTLVIGSGVIRFVTWFIMPTVNPAVLGLSYFKNSFLHWNSIIFCFTNLITIIALSTSLKVLKLWFKNYVQNKILKQEKLEAELQFLKGQINPHFLFNTLNNLYALTLKDSKNAAHVVLKLSSLMDYMLYETNVDFVPLEKEIEVMQNYIELERLRYGGDHAIDLFVQGEPKNWKVAPLIFLPFIENAFKHGFDKLKEGGYITVVFDINPNTLTYKVENNLSSAKKTRAKKTGVGLPNIKKRLELIYQGNHELNVIQDEDSYLTILKLKMNAV